MSDIKIDYKNGVVEKGDRHRTEMIRRVFQKASAGEPITVGFLGGSITQGAVASDDTLCYAYRVYEWFGQMFPASEISYVNAGIGATDSEFAAARAKEDILGSDPDFVLMEFSVNDGCNDHFLETYEGCVRQILSSRPDMALMLMANVFYSEGTSSERIHRAVARHYGLPMVSIRTTIYDAILRGEFPKERITADDLHPNDEGHGLVANVITSYLSDVYESCREQFFDKSGEAPGAVSVSEAGLPSPLTKNRYEHSIKYDRRNSAGIIEDYSGFVPDESEKTAVRDCFKNGYTTREAGSYIRYKVHGACIAVQYTRTIVLPAPVARVTVDGDEQSAVTLDANFDETWGDKLELTDVYVSENDADHTVTIEITDVPEGCRSDFYLAGVIVSSCK